MSEKKGGKLTVRHFRKKKDKGEKIVALAVYDAPSARLAEENGVELILVGDSLGMAVMGFKSTISVTMEHVLHHCVAVTRGATRALVVADMPFMSYQVGVEQALLNAARMLQEGGADAVKLEGGKDLAPTVARLVAAGVPVLGHIGLLPQNVLTSGGYRVVGRTDEEVARLTEDAKALEAAGVFGMVLECVPAAISAAITAAVGVPTIGIGAGVGCDGQIQVMHDVVGLFPDFLPKHAKRYADLSKLMGEAFARYAKEVEDSVFPGPENSF